MQFLTPLECMKSAYALFDYVEDPTGVSMLCDYRLQELFGMSMLCDSRLQELFGRERIPASGVSDLLPHEYLLNSLQALVLSND